MGTIPSELGRVHHTYFNLSGNRLTGSIPTEIVQFYIFWLGLNELTGTFPTELAILTNIGM
jgi:hypothetical protein